MNDLTPTAPQAEGRGATLWEQITEDELRAAAKVARASGGVMMAGAAAAWELRADLMQESDLKDQLRLWLNA